MPLTPIVVRLLSTKRDLRNSPLLQKFCQFLLISVEQTQITNTKVGNGAAMASAIGKNKESIKLKKLYKGLRIAFIVLLEFLKLLAKSCLPCSVFRNRTRSLQTQPTIQKSFVGSFYKVQGSTI